MFGKKKSILPGFGISLGYTVFYLSIIVIIPIAGLFIKTSSLSFAEFWSVITEPRVIASYKLSFGASFLAALTNAVFGLLIAWVLVRYNFFGKKIVDALIDLPFALPTAVAGITLATIYSKNGWFGRFLEPAGIFIAYKPAGIFVALVFIGLPFIVRSVQPVIEELDKEVEEAAASLGANRLQTFFKVIFPTILPALISGFILAFARGLGEYGSVVFISGNMPMVSEITPLLILTKLEQYDYVGATALAVSTLVISFVLFFSINLVQWWAANRHKA
ncbi:MAG: sulfate ABC transporter permease subunit CysT [Leptospiraceae bacterium]|jgi:sulfate transport system permease protein|nr:sulfate ABC transporter permease subunit CysT [Leptospiraceae bacterium]MBK7057525.1 sulfate ABC transporter permease subunit CysT [Leptospiraceae bacterium]MBK9500608.1 sulfate ABC transporter permease subunit CysT [Leptospiraceae bacterium]MBL0264942.1 sulfate ABC transporter permease subunit CysT [Leptospiraceae bacterium]MBP9165127.1 sulfate ABC transporter permease subunit CysT [Leptospiraceae bacterium]